MKRSEINLSPSSRVNYLRKNRTAMGHLLLDDLDRGDITQYEANARHLVATEVIELFQLMKSKGMTLAQLTQLVEDATKTSSGWKAPELFAS